MVWRAFLVIALLTVALVSLLSRRERPYEMPAGVPPEPPQPGYYMTGAQLTDTGADGLPLYRMAAAQIQQNPTDLSIALKDLKFVYRAPQGEVARFPGGEWTLTALNGFMPPNSRTLDMRGDVRIVGQVAREGAHGEIVPTAALIRTSRLFVNMQTHVASTPERVDMSWGNLHVSTVGLKADLKTERLQLESSVHGVLIP